MIGRAHARQDDAFELTLAQVLGSAGEGWRGLRGRQRIFESLRLVKDVAKVVAFDDGIL